MAKSVSSGRRTPPQRRAYGNRPKTADTEQATLKRAAKQSVDEVLDACGESWDIAAIREEYEAGYNKDKNNQDEGYLDLKYVAGDPEAHWDVDAWSQRDDEGRPALIVNQCGQFVRQVTGDIRQMRPAVKVMPIDDKASKTMAAKELPGLVRYVERRSMASGIYFAGADQCVGAGIGHWMVAHEYASTKTHDQELRIVPVPDGLAVVWDPDSVLLDRSDADFCFVPWDMSARAFKKKYPDGNSAAFSTSVNSAFSQWTSDDHVRVALYFCKRKCTLKLATLNGQTFDVTDDPAEEARLAELGAKIKDRDSHKVYRAVVSAHEILEPPEEWPGPDIPVVPMIGEEIIIGRQVSRRGVVRVLRDVQRIYNYSISTQTEVVALQPKAPFIGTRKQFEKYLDQWETANTRNWPFLEYTADGSAPPPQRAATPQPSPGMSELMMQTTQAMYATTGIYPSALGAKSNESSGKAILARQREGDTGTYVYIDAFGRAVQRTGQIIINMAGNIYDTERRLQIAGEDGKPDEIHLNQVMIDPQGDGIATKTQNDLSVGAYEVTVEMGPAAATKREEAREGMTQMLQMLGPGGGPMFVDLFAKAQDWPLADKIAQRAKMMLPPQIQQMEAAEAGEQFTPPPPPPPTPEQIKQQKLEQAEMLDREERERNAQRKHELDLKSLDVKSEEISLRLRELDAKAAELQASHAQQQLAHEQTMAQHAAATAEAQQDPRLDEVLKLVEQLTQAVEQLAGSVETIEGEVQQMAQDHEVYVAEQKGKEAAAPETPDHMPAMIDLANTLAANQGSPAPDSGTPQNEV